MRRIALHKKGRVVAYAIVDSDMRAVLAQHTWYLGCYGGAYRYRRIDGVFHNIAMHREVVGRAPRGLEIDHINGNRKDNRRANLRKVSHAVNMQNRKLAAHSSSGVHGVSYRTGRGWIARIQRHGRRVTLGTFSTKRAAAHARRNA